MTIFLWVVGIHLVELILFLGYLLIKKNQALEQVAISQQQQIEAISILIGRMNESFQQLDDKVWIGEDQELQTIFNEMKEIQKVLDSLK